MPLTDFRKYTDQEFAEAFQKEVKNGDFRELLTWHTREGIDVLPFYAASNQNSPIVSSKNEWEINDEIEFSDGASGNKSAIKKLGEGASSLTFRSPVKSKKELDILLENIGIQYIELNFKNSGIELIQWLAGYCDERKTGKDLLRGSFYLSDATGPDTVIFPQMQLFFVDGCKFHNAGGTITSQLAYTIAGGKEFLDRLLDKGWKAEEAIRNLRFQFAIGPDFFFETAKLRAFRILWHTLTSAYQKDHEIPCSVHAETSGIWLAKEDANNNLIRATFQCISAVAGGADSVFVQNFDAGKADGERLSKNVQLILKEEGFLDKTGDVAAGSYYIENITVQLVTNSWKKFQEIEKSGGYQKVFSSGQVAEEMSEAAFQLKTEIAEGKIKVIGVNKHRTDKTEKQFRPVKEKNADLKPVNLFG